MISDAITTWTRMRSSSDLAVAGVMVVALVLFAAAFARDWSLPGLYMDAINPEYLIPGILEPPPPTEYILPGNKIFGERFPVFTGTYYHGSVQLYTAMPFMQVFGSTIDTFRFVQLLVGAGILVLAIWMAGSPSFGPLRALAAGAAAVLALDPAFVLSLRTQAYSTIFPLLLLLGSVLLLRSARRGPRAWLRLAVSGFLYGLAVFAYFIFAFFLPALLWFLLRRDPVEGTRRSFALVASWFAGVVVGYLPFIAGMLLIRRELGGFSQLFDWFEQSRNQLEVTQDQTGLVDRISTVFTDSRRVFSGEWPWLMILQRPRTGLLESLKADLLLLLPLLVLLVPSLASRGHRRAIGVPMALVLSFGAGALLFGSRLDGHHYTAVLPLIYVAFGGACAALFPWSPQASWKAVLTSRADAARGFVVVVAVGVVSVTSLLAEQDFHSELRATGGVRLYSDSIDRFAEELDRHTPAAGVHAPDWGFEMPVAFLSSATPIRRVIDVEALRQETCAGKPQVVVLLGGDNQTTLRLVGDLAGRPLRSIRTWSQRDDVPVFQTARFAAATDCEPTAPAQPPPSIGGGRNRPAIRVSPAAIPACPFLANIRATVGWRVPGRREDGVEVTVQAPNAPEAVFAEGGARGFAETGPWAVAGTRFALRDPVTHRELAETELGAASCPRPEPRVG